MLPHYLFKGIVIKTALAHTDWREKAGSGRRWLQGGAIIKWIQSVSVCQKCYAPYCFQSYQ